jgi:hypothetical protein
MLLCVFECLLHAYCECLVDAAGPDAVYSVLGVKVTCVWVCMFVLMRDYVVASTGWAPFFNKILLCWPG